MASAAAAVVPAHPAGPLKTKPTLTIDATNLAKPSTPNFVVPTILITPPDTPPQYSASIPEQQYEKSVLFVPVKTDELGWDEHGLYWNGTYAYPVHQIYDKEGQPIGRRRKGPAGYRFEEYYHNKKPRRSTLASSSSSATWAMTADDTVEEASVRLEEPAPARIESTQKAAAVVQEDAAPASKEVAAMDEDELVSPTSPTLSVASSDLTETEDSSSLCDDSSSLWSRNDADSDGDESRCTSPGTMTPPPMDVDSPTSLQAETLSKKLSDLPAGNDRVSKTSWMSLGTLPSSSSSPSSSRSQSLPVPRTSSSRTKPALEISQQHRASSSLIVNAQHRESRRHSSPSTYASIIQDLTTSPFASQAATPSRSATLPRSSSRSGYSAKVAGGLRPPPTTFARTSGRSSGRGSGWNEPDFAAGWTFENPSSIF